MRPLFIGQAPSKTTDGREHNEVVGGTGRRLASLAGLPYDHWSDQVEFINLLERWPGYGDGGDNFPISKGRRAAEKLLADERLAPFTVLLGRNVCRAFGHEAQHYLWVEREQAGTVVLVASMPHPSGVSRHWNDPRNVEGAGYFVRRVLRLSRALTYEGAGLPSPREARLARARQSARVEA